MTLSSILSITAAVTGVTGYGIILTKRFWGVYLTTFSSCLWWTVGYLTGNWGLFGSGMAYTIIGLIRLFVGV